MQWHLIRLPIFRKTKQTDSFIFFRAHIKFKRNSMVCDRTTIVLWKSKVERSRLCCILHALNMGRRWRPALGLLVFGSSQRLIKSARGHANVWWPGSSAASAYILDDHSAVRKLHRCWTREWKLITLNGALQLVDRRQRRPIKFHWIQLATECWS